MKQATHGLSICLKCKRHRDTDSARDDVKTYHHCLNTFNGNHILTHMEWKNNTVSCYYLPQDCSYRLEQTLIGHGYFNDKNELIHNKVPK